VNLRTSSNIVGKGTEVIMMIIPAFSVDCTCFGYDRLNGLKLCIGTKTESLLGTAAGLKMSKVPKLLNLFLFIVILKLLIAQ